MSSNRTARQRLERIFGKICMIEQLGIRYIPKDERKKIKGYTKYDDMLTYHHIEERQFGGKATDENGALVRGYNHRWLHSLPEHHKQSVNNAMQEFKASIIYTTGSTMESAEHIRMQMVDMDALKRLGAGEFTSIPAYDNTVEDYVKRQKFNRPKVKRQTQRYIEDEMELYEQLSFDMLEFEKTLEEEEDEWDR